MNTQTRTRREPPGLAARDPEARKESPYRDVTTTAGVRDRDPGYNPARAEKLLRCDVCPFACRSKDDMANHRKTHKKFLASRSRYRSKMTRAADEAEQRRVETDAENLAAYEAAHPEDDETDEPDEEE